MLNRRFLLAGLMMVLLGSRLIAAPETMGAQTQASTVQMGSTMDNLMTAYDGASNAYVRYVAFAKKADEEGYKGVASLFRAAARSKQIQAKLHAAFIKKMKGTPKADIKQPAIKSTRENLQSAIAGDTFESTVMYPAYLKKARTDGIGLAQRTFNAAKTVEAGHAQLFQKALKNLEGQKTPQLYYICPTCGNTVTTLDLARCSICYTTNEVFEKIS